MEKSSVGLPPQGPTVAQTKAKQKPNFHALKVNNKNLK
jgi:hypothetical protein